ncbi:hypothetical protein ITI46_02480 [Streptomyces oryzae]|uniref:Integral membrane protein n=1 Tax=Streptomyces oryzae TaxID=1434886 RepID=A0ABS3X5D2_9ACTN|nr:hypothetical protein [Streptomyces oryzae]MBO8190583.1 hypothetical protein [Streptomyces oryzae]
MSGSGGPLPGRRTVARSPRAHALAVLRVRSTALALALLPAAAAVILWVGRTTGQFGPGPGWDAARWAVTGLAVAALACAVVAGLVIAGGRPAVSPTVPVEEGAAPDLHALVRDLADRLEVPAPSAIALTPDCDSWLEDRTHFRADTGEGSARGAAPVLVIGSPFLWWMRVAELRALLAPVVAGTGPSAHPDIAAARRFVRGLDAAVAGAERPSDPARGPGHASVWGPGPPGPLAAALGGPGPLGRALRGGAALLRRAVHRLVGPLARLMLRAAGPYAAAMEQGVAAAAADRAQAVGHGLRVAAQEQVGLAYAGWDRLLTRVALPAWRLGLWPTRLDAGVVSALTELSRRDRLAEGFTSRLGERPACDLLKEPGTVDGAVSLLAARLFLGPCPPVPAAGLRQTAPEWTPVEWSAYPEEVVDRIWRSEAARLFAALDATGAPSPASAGTPRAAEDAASPLAVGHSARSSAVGAVGAAGPPVPEGDRRPTPGGDRRPVSGGERPLRPERDSALRPEGRSSLRSPEGHGSLRPERDSSRNGDDPSSAPGGAALPAGAAGHTLAGPTLARVLDRFASPGGIDALAARISAEVARVQTASAPGVIGASPGAGPLPGAGSTHLAPLAPMGLPLQPPRGGKELLADHITAAVCCAAVDTAGATPGLDWLDGPALYVEGRRTSELSALVLALVEDGETAGLRDWLAAVGVRPEKPVRLV